MKQTNAASVCNSMSKPTEYQSGEYSWCQKPEGDCMPMERCNRELCLSDGDENQLARWVMYSSVDNTPNISLPTSEQH